MHDAVQPQPDYQCGEDARRRLSAERCPATDYGQIGFYCEFDMSICNDGSFMPARLPCIARRTDIFVYHLCQFTPLAWST